MQKNTVTAGAHIRSAAEEKRRLCFVIWNFEIMEDNAFRDMVKRAKTCGFTTIRLHLSWFNAEKNPLCYDFAPYDRQIAFVLAEGMDVILTVDLQRRAHTLDGARVCTDTVVTTDEFQYRYGESTPFLPDSQYDTLLISPASRKGTELAVRFYRDAVRHFVGKFGSGIYAVSPTFTPYCETEYWCVGSFDYSPHMISAYRRFLAETYGSVGDLNRDLGTRYTAFSEVYPPDCHDKSNAGILFYQCRHKYLKAFIDALAAAHRAAAPDTLFSVQFGCVWDAASAARCTYGFRSLSEKAELVIVDDAPRFRHPFSMDYVAGTLAGTGKYFGNEIDGYYMIRNGVCDAEDYIEQGLSSYRHNATVQYVANWQFDPEAFTNNGYIFTSVADAYLNPEKPRPFCVSEKPKTEQLLDVSVKTLFTTGDSDYYTGYYNLYTDCGHTYTRIRVTDDLTTAVLPHSVRGKENARRAEAEKRTAERAERTNRHTKKTALSCAAAALTAGIAILCAGAAAELFLENKKKKKTDRRSASSENTFTE